jgi:hypothetical protein
VEERVLSLEELKNLNPDNLENTGPASLEIRVDGDVVAQHGHLCPTCREITVRYVKQIAKRLEKKSSFREREESEDEEAAE